MALTPILLALAASFLVAPQEAPDDAPPRPAMNKSWAQRLPEQDRAALETTVGFAAPELSEDLAWLGDRPESLEALRGKVVLVQTFTTRSTLGRNTPRRLSRAVADLAKEEDLVVLLIHTPEGANKAERYCTRVEMPFPVAIDSGGRFCDSLGAFKRPVNYLIDRTGDIVYAGLNDKGLIEATKELLDKPHDPKAEPTPRPKSGAEAEGFPQFRSPLASAADLRGLEAPTFYVQEWITQRPNGQDKVAVIDFWATWCGPCVKAIPHMNDLQNQFVNDVVCIGISDESSDAFETGLRRRDLGPSNFRYSLALDPTGQMKRRFAIRGIPHVTVISSDWIVRWQGHPSTLSADVLNAIVDANKAMLEQVGDGSPGAPPARWRAAG